MNRFIKLANGTHIKRMHVDGSTCDDVSRRYVCQSQLPKNGPLTTPIRARNANVAHTLTWITRANPRFP